MRWALAIGLMAIVCASAAAAKPSESAERVAIRQRLAKDRVKSQFLRNEERSVLGALTQIEEEIENAAIEVESLGEDIQDLDEELGIIRVRRGRNNQRIEDLRARFGRRAAALVRLDRTRMSRLLARAKSPADARRLRDRFRFVRNYDLQLVSGIVEAGQTDRKLEAKLAKKQTDLRSKKLALEESGEARLQLEADRRELLEAIRQERVSVERVARDLKGAARELDKYMGRTLGDTNALAEPAEGGFSAQRGRLPWPARGKLEASFGKKVDPDSEVVLVQKGIDLGASFGSEVRSVFSGRVVFAGFKSGYGRLVVIDHGGGYSLYAHLERSLVRRGANVNQQQVVGIVGDSGSTKGTYLYFELRVGREPVDPLKWLEPQ